MSVARRHNALRGTMALTLLALTAGVSLAVGTRPVAWAEIWAGLTGHVDSIGAAAVAVRMPRTVLALLAGAALGVAGAVMQGITRNPLADPGILGVNAGAALFVVVGIAWFDVSGAAAFMWLGVAGAGCAAVFVYVIGSTGQGGATPLKLTLAGTATSIATSAFIVALVLPRNDISGSVQAWQVGGVGGASFDTLLPALPFLIAGLLLSLAAARVLNALALGEDLAAGLGQNVAAGRIMSAAGAILLCGAATALCGPIGFVGLVVPHAARMFGGIDHRVLLPLSAIGGAVLLGSADVLGRVIARPNELDVGVVTAFVGAPFFIWSVRRQRMHGL
ncbi:iron ABC transporter permease [Sulfitobacter pseudonitzschiae]|uniref:Iron ABC transporter permease n=2 Tax=Pseudosulfitobacter pseudonitzschiae TaxID=1402135 RepID=A0A9Q2NLP0_9RHOB|nr:iron ABC transporter permease [Pseudosulfitobacter pseudonitzschiae]MBM2299266.1 iron ABC transporter permease [Pseudosulfitobacter pseudonitzschiae]MBM2304174.1 iron ABC transporter permease [Pseudosulfitobacter pseudonitzschiae]MBM2313954.1 iron ABC transporter permease [Pseudosulfitobacter pseudonitzschiae]MBM2318868.1 iron ABC transporter permease [Pseudosulfitobacter pseudonitzschiae]